MPELSCVLSTANIANHKQFAKLMATLAFTPFAKAAPLAEAALLAKVAPLGKAAPPTKAAPLAEAAIYAKVAPLAETAISAKVEISGEVMKIHIITSRADDKTVIGFLKIFKVINSVSFHFITQKYIPLALVMARDFCCTFFLFLC